ncbi:MAG: C45 family autoproteolytic acyltransferase/hydrolase [Alphaproteobacteria bacterium]
MELTFEAVAENEPGPLWAAAFRRDWPATRAWYLSEGIDARPSPHEGRDAIRRHMPELVPLYDRLCHLAGDDPVAHSCLSLWCPPPVMPGCSQAVWRGDGGPALVRNYDFDPGFTAGRITAGRWLGRRTIVMGEAAWGCLDGMNEDGLAASLTFGGRPGTGCGFSIVLVLRYVLETCAGVAEAAAAIARIPVFMAQNVTLVDRAGNVATVFVGHDREAAIVADAVCTNHQEQVVWPEQAAAVRSVERRRWLGDRVAEAGDLGALTADFLAPPLHQHGAQRWFRTVYTAAYRPAAGSVDYLWPDHRWTQSFAQFSPGSHVRRFADIPA